MPVPRDRHPGGRPRKYDSPEQMQAAADKYFQETEAKDEPYTMTGLAIALGMDRKSLVNYADRDEFFPIIKDARAKVEARIESLSMQGKINPTMAIFNLKNNFGWRDQSQLDINADVRQDIVIDIEDSPDDEDFDS